jgi:hypothetical protein
MSRNTDRAGEYVGTIPELLTFSIRSPDDVILQDSLETRLGQDFVDAAADYKRAFAGKLAEVTAHFTGAPARELSGDPHEAAAAPTHRDPLRLDEGTRDMQLYALRELGAALRKMLDPDLVAKARDCGFLAGRPEEPSLAFFERQAPILWEMLYEGEGSGEIDWRRFWGFRAPIAHWRIGGPITSREIRVRNGVFSAISEDLCGANPEVDALVEQLERRVAGVRHSSLDRALRERLSRHGLLAPAVAGPVGAWLRTSLANKSEFEKQVWKNDALVEIFRDARSRYELLHFACHCEAGVGSEMHSCLVLQVAGEPLTLKVSAMASKVEERRDRVEMGPLVFLNACGSGLPHTPGKPPGFPNVWIQFGALAVIATLCPVPDAFAHAFADYFYGLLFPNREAPGTDRYRYLADALWATRCHFMEKYNNPLGLAYVLYARRGAEVLSERRYE